MENSFVSGQYDENEVEQSSEVEEQQAVIYDENGQYYDENGYLCDAYGYYDEEGEYHEYEEGNNDGDISEIEHDGKKLLVDKHGRILSEQKIAEADPNLPEDYDVFMSVFQPQRLASVLDADAASLCVWPNEPPPLSLIRFDYYENTGKLSHFGTTDLKESRKVRHSGSFVPIKSLLFINKPTSLTKELEIFKAAPPLRSRFKPLNSNNKRDVARWLPSETVHAFVGAPGNVGSVDYHIEWTDGPDRYTLNSSLDARAGWRRLWRFAAYPVTQYFILQRSITHECMGSEGGTGKTYDIVTGSSVFARKHWRLLGSFYAFDLQLPCTNKYTVYTAQEPFHRMRMSMGSIYNTSEWKEQFSFYTFDIPIQGTCQYELQHCVRSIQTTDASVSRHRLTTEAARLPWQFRMSIYVFPANKEDCSVVFECDNML